MIANYRGQAAASLPLWIAALRNGECLETRNAVDAGLSFKKSLTTELGVPHWVWRRLRVLKSTLIAEADDKGLSLRWIARTIGAMGPDTPLPPNQALHQLCSFLHGLDSEPPSRMSLALARGVGLEVRRKGWAKTLSSFDPAPTRGCGPTPLYRAQIVVMPMVGHALNALLLSANRDRVSLLSEMDVRGMVPVAIGNLYSTSSYSRIIRYCAQWAEDMRFGGISSRPSGLPTSPVLIPYFSDRIQQVTVRQLITRNDLENESLQMSNCVKTLWPQLADAMGIVFSLTTSDPFERASVFCTVDGDGTWHFECVGPENTFPGERLLIVARDLSTRLKQSLDSQPSSIQGLFQRASRRKARYRCGGSLYSNVLTATHPEIERMRAWFPCGNLDPVSRLRAAWPKQSTKSLRS